MNIEEFRDYCLNKKGVSEDFPFTPNVIVFKVMNKMFCLSDIEDFKQMNLKCEPEYALDLREEFYSIKPGWHMNKKHWNTVEIDGDANDQKIFELIDHSYEMVVKSLTKKLKEELSQL